VSDVHARVKQLTNPESVSYKSLETTVAERVNAQGLIPLPTQLARMKVILGTRSSNDSE
jgi:hypothetical protein